LKKRKDCGKECIHHRGEKKIEGKKEHFWPFLQRQRGQVFFSEGREPTLSVIFVRGGLPVKKKGFSNSEGDLTQKGHGREDMLYQRKTKKM